MRSLNLYWSKSFAHLKRFTFGFLMCAYHRRDPLPKNFWTTRQRLAKLRSLALIKTEKVFSTGRAQFLLTPIGWQVITTHAKELISIRPVKQIDFSLYDHDRRVTLIRALTEAKGKCKLWHSDKWLKASPVMIDSKYKFNFAKDLRPDAFFINSKGEKVALELEVAKKSRSRLEEKIELYDNLMSEAYRASPDKNEKYKVIDKVWFIATKLDVARLLLRVVEARSKQPLNYRVDFYDEIIPEVAAAL
jgi:hypothetical protein